jgi:hypothetical protein
VTLWIVHLLLFRLNLKPSGATLLLCSTSKSIMLSQISLSPCSFNSLPFELASYIFELAAIPGAYAEDEELQSSSRQALKMPFILASVSRTWRHVALTHTPQMWSHIEFSPRSRQLDGPHTQLLDRVERSRKCPLHIFIDLRAPTGTSPK